MLKTETSEISCWYDYESVRAISVRCDCGALIPDEALEQLTDVACPICGKTVKLAELDAFADSLEWRISELSQHT